MDWLDCILNEVAIAPVRVTWPFKLCSRPLAFDCTWCFHSALFLLVTLQVKILRLGFLPIVPEDYFSLHRSTGAVTSAL